MRRRAGVARSPAPPAARYTTARPPPPSLAASFPCTPPVLLPAWARETARRTTPRQAIDRIPSVSHHQRAGDHIVREFGDGAQLSVDSDLDLEEHVARRLEVEAGGGADQ